jgi:hypothetical protein
MFIPPYDLPTDTYTVSGLLKASVYKEGIPRDKTTRDKKQRTRMHKPARYVFLNESLTSKNRLKTKQQARLINNPATFFSISDVNPQHIQGVQKYHSNVRLPFLASNDDERDG